MSEHILEQKIDELRARLAQAEDAIFKLEENLEETNAHLTNSAAKTSDFESDLSKVMAENSALVARIKELGG